jgi:hypothetical protein
LSSGTNFTGEHENKNITPASATNFISFRVLILIFPANANIFLNKNSEVVFVKKQ